MSLYCQDSPVTPFLLGTGLLMEIEAWELCQEWPFSCYHLLWAEQGTQVRIPATSAGSSTPYTVLCGAAALLVLLQSAALHTASQLRRCQAGPGMGYMPSTVGASDCLELPFPYCRNPSPTALRRGISSALLFLLSQTMTESLLCCLLFVLAPCCCCSVSLLWQGRENRLLLVPRHGVTQDPIWYLQIQDCGRTGIYSQLT